MFSRRGFMKIGAASVGSLALRNFGLLPAMAQGASGYKALVCVFLFGGNDSNNTIIPIDLSQATYDEYLNLRGSLALTSNDLTSARADVNGKHYYFHNGLTELADLFTQGRLAVAANVGPLVTYVKRTQTGVVSGPVPEHLFSHSDQQTEWQTSDPSEQQTPFGWGGRAAQYAQALNAGSFPALLSVAGNDVFGLGPDPQIALNPGGSLNLSGFDYTLEQHRSAAFDTLLQTETGLSLVSAANGVMLRSIADAEILSRALKGVSVTTTFPQTSLGAQLKQVAQIIKAREGLQMQRQIFFCSLGGFDTHTGEIEAHQRLYPELSQAVNAFYTALSDELMMEDNVTLFTESDFSRTFQPTTGDGSDHAWGSHHIVLGGAVKGQAIYGTFPTFALGSNDDFDTRGRWIPSSSVDQYGASLVDWFGVDPSKVFPNLGNFRSKKNPFTFLG